MTIKKVKYQITLRKYLWVEVEDENQERIVRELNNDFDKMKKRTRTYYRKCLSINAVFDAFGLELKDDRMNVEEIFYKKERDEIINKGISLLSPKQKQTVIDYFYENKSFGQIAQERGVNIKSVYENYKNALANLKKFFEKIKYDPQ